ncbi:MAG: hypothetical protein RLZZ617_894, partial [Bacteroidota bacterium]
MKSILNVSRLLGWGLWVLVLSACGQMAQTAPESERDASSDSSR